MGRKARGTGPKGRVSNARYALDEQVTSGTVGQGAIIAKVRAVGILQNGGLPA